EPQRLIRWAAIKVVFEFDTDPLRHRGLHDCDELPAPYKINRHPVIITTLIGRLPNHASGWRRAGGRGLLRPGSRGVRQPTRSRAAGRSGDRWLGEQDGEQAGGDIRPSPATWSD